MAGVTLPIEAAQAVYKEDGNYDPFVLAEKLKLVVDSQVDLDDISWLLDICKTTKNRASKGKPGQIVCSESLRILRIWVSSLLAEKPKPGEQAPLRFDMVENAVTLLLDVAVKDRSMQEKVQFLLDKGVTIPEIKYAW
mmetsp:Transcript_1732/g.2009  ORF Transcript_1732/g.2009 Transcript_1732/m.2009 type:complete len:138 (+) Transcript_1732:113-526(+)